MTVKFHLAELPAQFDMSNKSCTQQYTADKSQSGPFSLHRRLCNDFAKSELNRLENFSILSPLAESIISRNVDNAFPIEEPPEKKSRSNVRSKSACPPNQGHAASSSTSWPHGQSSSTDAPAWQWSEWHRPSWSSSSWKTSEWHEK